MFYRKVETINEFGRNLPQEVRLFPLRSWVIRKTRAKKISISASRISQSRISELAVLSAGGASGTGGA